MEQAVALWHRLNSLSLTSKWTTYGATKTPSEEFRTYAKSYTTSEAELQAFWKICSTDFGLWGQVDSAFDAVKLDVVDWKPEPEIIIAGYKVVFLEDKVKVGCTEVTKEQLKEILKRMDNTSV